MATNEQNYNINTGYGRMLANAVASMVPTFGRILVVSGTTSDNNYARLNKMFVPKSGRIHYYVGTDALSSAITEAETGSYDVILLDGHNTHSLSAGIALTKGRLNFIGLDGGDRLVQQGAKVQLATAATTAYVMKNTGVRNSFRNIKFIQAATAATGLNVMQMGGEGNLYKNCSFTFGVADNLDLTTAAEVICGEDSGTFIDCQFGQDTLLTSAARSIFVIDQVTASQEFKSNIFKDCTWIGSSSDTGMQAISMAAAGDILFTNHFIRPSFLASLDSAGGVACVKAVSTANGTTKGCIYVSYPTVHGFDDIGVNGTNNDNLYVFSHAPSAANITSAKPTTS